eukprot:3115529-Amphidinium_carterae.1
MQLAKSGFAKATMTDSFSALQAGKTSTQLRLLEGLRLGHSVAACREHPKRCPHWKRPAGLQHRRHPFPTRSPSGPQHPSPRGAAALPAPLAPGF